MKTLIAIAMSLLVSIGAVAAELDFRKPASWQEALDAARSQNKYLFVDAYTDWCGWCKVMDQKAFSNETIASMMNGQFVNVKIEMETDFGIDVAMKYRVSSFPQFLIFTPEGKLIKRMYGYRPPEEFGKEIYGITQVSQHESYPGITDKFDLPYPDFLRGAFEKGKNRKNPDPDVVSAWLDKQQDPTSEVAWTVMSRCALSEKWENWILDNRNKLSELYGGEANQRATRTIYGKVVNAVKEQDRAAFDQAVELWPKDADDRERFVASMELQYLHCWNVYEKCEDLDVVRSATKVMSQVIEGADWAAWDTYASLQFKSGDLKGAEQSAAKAIALGNEGGQNVSSTEELLVKIKAAQ